MRRPASDGRGRCSGAVAVEFAIVFPPMLLCMLGLAEFGRAIWTQATLDYAVQSAARCAAIDQTDCGTATQIQQYAAGKAAGLLVAPSNFAVSTQACGVTVTASLPYQFVVPALFPYALTLNAAACFPV